VPLTFARAPRRILVVPVLAVSLAWGLMIWSFYVPVCTATILMTSIVTATRKVPRWFGGVLVAIYIVFVGYCFTRLSHAF
jgi:fructose-specific phosphotransferase system IIC component